MAMMSTRENLGEDEDGNETGQGLDSGTVVIGGEKITPSKPISEKDKKKLAQREAKRKRDEIVSKDDERDRRRSGNDRRRHRATDKVRLPRVIPTRSDPQCIITARTIS